MITFRYLYNLSCSFFLRIGHAFAQLVTLDAFTSNSYPSESVASNLNGTQQPIAMLNVKTENGLHSIQSFGDGVLLCFMYVKSDLSILCCLHRRDNTYLKQLVPLFGCSVHTPNQSDAVESNGGEKNSVGHSMPFWISYHSATDRFAK